MKANSSAHRRRKILVNCEDAPKWEGYQVIWQEILSQSKDDAWEVYRAPHGHIPDPGTVQPGDVMVLTGSHYGANEDYPWIHALAAAVPQYIAAGARIIASCFGHQLVSKALGGTVAKNPSQRFVLHLERVRCNKEAMQAVGLLEPLQHALRTARDQEACSAGKDDFPQLAPPDAPELVLQLVESHGECVSQLPPGAVLLAHSDTATHEMYAYGDNVLCFQFHPEVPPRLALDKILPALRDQGRLTPEEADAFATSLRDAVVDKKHLADLPAKLPDRRDDEEIPFVWDSAPFHLMLHHFMDHGLRRAGAAGAAAGAVAGATAGAAAAEGAGEPRRAEAAEPAGSQGTAGTTAQGKESSQAGGADATGAKGDGAALAGTAAALERLVVGARQGFDAGMQGTRVDCQQLAGMNQVAVASCGAAADKAEELAGSCQQLRVSQQD